MLGKLKKHVLTKHEGVRYSCDYCTNTEEVALKQHIDGKGVRVRIVNTRNKFWLPNKQQHILTKHMGKEYDCAQSVMKPKGRVY